MFINFNDAKKVAVGCLAMSSCAFFLWINQSGIRADQTNVQQSTGNTMIQVAASTNEQSVNQSTINPQDHGNYACLDREQVDANGNLNVAGWHATNASQGCQYHYLIAYDATNHREISRQNVTNQVVSRPDVAKVHQVYGAANSGFKTTFKLGNQIASLDQVQIISRYANDVAGNGNPVDYWFAPITINRSNYAHLDKVAVADNHLVISGWHATNLAVNKPHHYIIVLDRSNNREVGRYLIKEPVPRPDVTKALSGVVGVAKAGFVARFPLANISFNHQLQILSRYSASADGNRDYVDYWFKPITMGNETNRGNLDRFNLSNGKTLSIAGWHANDLAKFERNHFLILYDQTAKRQVDVIKAKSVDRPDVGKAFPNIKQADHSGFNGRFDINNYQLQAGHTYTIVSRYSSSNQENGGHGQHTDYWFAPFTLNKQASYLDTVRMTNDGLQVAGWLTSDQSLNKPNAYLIVLNNGHEIKRVKLSMTARPDVARLYSHVFNSMNSGFSCLVPFKPAQITGNMQIILRLSGSADGNRDYVDLLNKQFNSNDGSFDRIDVNQNSIYVSGWHASNQSSMKPYQWLIFLDTNGHELYRQRVLDVNNPRNDLAKQRAYILNASHAGFKLGFNIPRQLQNHVVRIIHRITDDKNGNGNYVDRYSALVDINAYSQRLKNRWQQIINSYGMPVSIAIQKADTGEVIDFTNASGQSFVTASTVKVGILEKLLHNQGGNLTGAQLATASRMIEVSDNSAATALYNEIGGMNGLNELFRELGLTASHCYGHWGLTMTNATDQLKLLHEIFLNPTSNYLNRSGQQVIQNLMAQVTPSQRWGISAGSSNFYIKNGWNTTDAWNVSSIGYIPGKYTIAIYTKNPSYNNCRNLIEQLAMATRQTVG